MPSKNNILIVLLSSFLVISVYFNLNSTTRPGFAFFELVSDQIDSRTVEEQTKEILDLYYSFERSEFKKYSQNKEDGVIERILTYLNMTTPPGYFVEFGCEDGTEINTRYLREKYNWKGLLLSGFTENKEINLHKEIIMHSNILGLFEKYLVPRELDLLSEDTDYADYWIVETILTKYRPKVLIHEVNQQKSCVTVPKQDNITFWDSTNYHGASVCAFHCLAKQFGYTMVYCESAGVNCFMIRNDLLKKVLKVDLALVRKVLNPDFLFKQPSFTYKSTNKPWNYVNCTI
jgi:hypothetical protein